jgi:hypothetical protein
VCKQVTSLSRSYLNRLVPSVRQRRRRAGVFGSRGGVYIHVRRKVVCGGDRWSSLCAVFVVLFNEAVSFSVYISFVKDE